MFQVTGWNITLFEYERATIILIEHKSNNVALKFTSVCNLGHTGKTIQIPFNFQPDTSFN